MSTRQEKFSGTKPVQAHLAFSTDKLEQFMRDKVEGFVGPLEVREFKRNHPGVLNAELVEQIMSTSYTIVSAFAKRNKSELVFLSQLRFELEK